MFSYHVMLCNVQLWREKKKLSGVIEADLMSSVLGGVFQKPEKPKFHPRSNMDQRPKWHRQVLHRRSNRSAAVITHYFFICACARCTCACSTGKSMESKLVFQNTLSQTYVISAGLCWPSLGTAAWRPEHAFLSPALQRTHYRLKLARKWSKKTFMTSKPKQPSCFTSKHMKNAMSAFSFVARLLALPSRGRCNGNPQTDHA